MKKWLERVNFWELSLTRKTILAVIFLGLLLEALFLPLALRAFLVATDYPPGFTKEAFHSVKVGDSCKNVLRTLGPPLSYRVVSSKQNEAGRVMENSQSITSLLHWETNNLVLIYLEYSKPKRTKGNFEAWEILIEAGVVKEKRNYTYWD